MALQPGSSRAAFKANLKRLRDEGKPIKQALAVAIAKRAGKGAKKKKPQSRKNLVAVLSPRG